MYIVIRDLLLAYCFLKIMEAFQVANKKFCFADRQILNPSIKILSGIHSFIIPEFYPAVFNYRNSESTHHVLMEVLILPRTISNYSFYNSEYQWIRIAQPSHKHIILIIKYVYIGVMYCLKCRSRTWLCGIK